MILQNRYLTNFSEWTPTMTTALVTKHLAVVLRVVAATTTRVQLQDLTNLT